MSPELSAAIRERIDHGYTKEAIVAELVTAGYTTEQGEAAYATAHSSSGLIGYGDLLTETWTLMKQEVGVLLRALLFGTAVFVAVSTAIFLVASVAGISSEESFFLTVAGIPLFGTLIGFVLSLSLMRALMKHREGQLFRTHVGFVVRHFIPLMVVTLYLTIVTQVGYALFFLPGVAATIYFLFATLLAVVGEERGFGALSGSVALVHGRFFAVLGRFLVVNLVVLSVAALVFLLGAVAFALSFVSATAVDFIIFPFIFVAILALTIGTFYAATCGLITLFESLSATKSAAAPVNRQSLETLFKIIVGIVVVLLALFAFILGFAGYALLEW